MTEPAKIPLVRNEVTSYTIVLKRLLLIQVMSGKVRQQLFKQI
jgi:hypothetical protein